mmetsp:Transcript_57048/g.150105  ORF Transcript_57048/g.150105 Transcript_57048/m.150105 type:complete len:211 (+) Transcript_57048:1050-1682(+)
MTSTRETTPLVTLIVSPPTGKPTQSTGSSRCGTFLLSVTAWMSFQNSSSSTVSTAQSHSQPTHITFARCLVSLPRRWTLTCTAHSMQCALVRITFFCLSMQKPEPLERYCRRLCQGSEKFGVLWTHQTLTTESSGTPSSSRPSSSEPARASSSSLTTPGGRFFFFFPPPREAEPPDGASSPEWPPLAGPSRPSLAGGRRPMAAMRRQCRW